MSKLKNNVCMLKADSDQRKKDHKKKNTICK